MKSPEYTPLLKLSTMAVLAATALSACSTSPKAAGVPIDHSIKEPVCTGVRLQQVDHDNFRVLPKLVGAFVDPANVRSFLDYTEPPAASSTAQTLPNTGGGVSGIQSGPAYEVGLQGTAAQPLTQLRMFDFQRHQPPDLNKLGGIPENVPVVDCPPTNLGRLVVQYVEHNP